MPAPTTCREFLDLLRRSDLLANDRLDDYLRTRRERLRGLQQPAEFAEILLADGLLSSFQAKQLLAGKHRGFWIKKYLVLESLGEGGMGRVILCEQTPMSRLVAVKVLPPTTQPGALERFQREARAVAALDHPNIVRAIDIDSEQRFHFLVMEYVDGLNLQDLVDDHGRLALGRACHYVAQAAQGLYHAHQAGWVHRDIKPGNLLVDRTGVVKILDMGLARLAGDSQDQLTRQFDDSAVLGTADYLAPEQSMPGQTIDGRADLYSLGATFYFLLTGKTPFGEGTPLQKIMGHQMREPKPITELRPNAPAELAEIIAHMMAKSPAHRLQTGQEVAEALRPFLTKEAYPLTREERSDACPRVRQLLQTAPPKTAPLSPLPFTAPRTPPPRARRWQRREVLLGAGMAGALLVLLLGWGLVNALVGSRGTTKPTPPEKKGPVVAQPKDETLEVVPGILTPAEAAQHLDKVCTVQMLVKSTGLAKNRPLLFLNSEVVYTSKSNFTIVVHGITAEAEKNADELQARFKDKTVQVEGLVKLYGKLPQIEVAELQKVRLVSSAK
jgi:serine/threonine protein kinase